MNERQKALIARPLTWLFWAFAIAIVIQGPWILYSYNYSVTSGRITDLSNHLGISYDFEAYGQRFGGRSFGSIPGRKYADLQVGESVEVYYWPPLPEVSSLFEPYRPPFKVLVRAALFGGVAFIFCFAWKGARMESTYRDLP